MLIENAKLPEGSGDLLVLLNGEHRLDHRIVDGDLIVDDSLLPAGSRLVILRDVPKEPPAKFNPAASMPTPVVLNRLIAWGVSLVNQVWELLTQKAMLMVSGPASVAVWDARGMPLSDIGEPLGESDACTLGLAKALAEGATRGVSRDIDGLAAALRSDLGSMSANFRPIHKKLTDLNGDVLGLQDMQRKVEADLRKELLDTQRGVAKRLTTLGEQIVSLKQAAERPRLTAGVEDIEGLALAISQELEALGKRIARLENKGGKSDE